MTDSKLDRLSNLEALWRRVQRMASIGGWVVDYPSGLVVWSEETYRIYEVDAALFQPTRVAYYGFLLPEDRLRVSDAEMKARRTGEPYHIEHRVVLPNGKTKHVREYAEVIVTNGEVTGLAGVVQDITEVKKLEVQLLQAQKLDSVGRLAGGIAHDFNNLLQVINGYTDILLEECGEEDPRHQYLTFVREAGERAATLTQQLLTFSRKQVPQLKLLDMNRAVAETEAIFRRIIGENIELRSLPDSTPCRVYADPGQMSQMMLNLAINARDAMPQGGALELATAKIVEDGLPYVELRVTDTGTGMTDEVLKHLFEPFFTTKERGSGTGIGLATVYGIVQQHDGRISVSSVLGEGSTFRILLPCAPEGAEVVSPSESNTESRAKGEKILVVEDDDLVRRVASLALRECGYNPLEATDAGAALEIVAREGDSIAVVISDVVMPGMSGTELVSHLRERHADMQFILMSGYTEAKRLGDALDYHNVRFMQKPFSLSEIVSHVSICLRQRKG